jgi:hypothetical protein
MARELQFRVILPVAECGFAGLFGGIGLWQRFAILSRPLFEGQTLWNSTARFHVWPWPYKFAVVSNMPAFFAGSMLLEHSFVGLGFAVAATPEDLEERAELFACLVRSHLAQRTMFVWLEQVGHVERKWVRYGAYLLTVLGGLAMLVGCFLLPVFEDQALEHRRQRSPNSRQASR